MPGRSGKRDAAKAEYNERRSRGGQPGNRNSAGKKNAAGSHKGAPAGNKNAEKDGAYSAIFFDMLTDEEREIVESAPLESRAALEQEMKILKFREHKILVKLEAYEDAEEGSLYVNSLLEVQGKNGSKMWNKDSAFARAMKLQEALYKVQGRITKVADGLRALDEHADRIEVERLRLEAMRERVTGVVECPDLEETDVLGEVQTDGGLLK